MLGAGLFQRLIDSGKHITSSLLETIISIPGQGHKQLKIDKSTNSQPQQTMLDIDTESKHIAETTTTHPRPVDGDTVEEEDDLSIQTIPYEINRYECECSECENNCDQDCTDTDEDVTDFLALHRLEIERLALAQSQDADASDPKSGTTVDIEVKDRVFMEQVNPNFGQRKDEEQSQDGTHHSEVQVQVQVQSLTRTRQQSNCPSNISNISKNIVIHSSEQDTIINTTKSKVPLNEFSERIEMVGRIDIDNTSENNQQSQSKHEILSQSQSQPDSNASLHITNANANAGLDVDVNKCTTEEETPIKPKRLLYLQENSGILPSSAQQSKSQSTSQQPLILSSDATISKKVNSINAAMLTLYTFSSDDEELEWIHVDTKKKFEDKKEGVLPMATRSDQGTSSKAMHSKIEQKMNLKEEIQLRNISSIMDEGSNRDAIIGTKCTAPSPSKGNCSTPSALSRVQSQSIEHSVDTAKNKTWINTDLSMLESSDDEEVPPRGNCVPAQDSKKVEVNRTPITNAKDPKDPRVSKGKGPDAKVQISSKGKEPASTDRTLNEATLSRPNKSSNCAETDVICLLDDSDSDSTIDLLESSSSDDIIICNESNSKTSSSIQKQGRDRKRKQSLTTSSNMTVITLFHTDDGHEASSWTASQRKRARKRAQRHSSGSRQTPSRDNGQVIVID